MKKWIHISTMLFLLVIVSVSCNQHETNLKSIDIDFNSIKNVDINKGKLVKLETTDLSLIYDISSLELLNDKMIIFTRGKSLVFDNNGKFLFNIGVRGNGPNEYVKCTSFYVKNNNYYVVDGVARKILCYNENGNFLSLKKLIPSSTGLIPACLYPLDNGKLVSKNTFQGKSTSTPAASILDEEYNHICAIKGRNIKSGFNLLGDNFSQFKDEILYWEPICDTIFSITNYKEIAPKYLVNFNKYAIPINDRKDKDVYDLMEYTNKPENKMKIATFLRYIKEDEHFVRFMFVFKQKIHYTKYDKLKKVSFTYCFEDVEKKFQTLPFVCYKNGYVYLSVSPVNDLESNPSLIVFDEKKLNKISTNK